MKILTTKLAAILSWPLWVKIVEVHSINICYELNKTMRYPINISTSAPTTKDCIVIKINSAPKTYFRLTSNMHFKHSPEITTSYNTRDHSEYGLSQWEEALLCNAFSHWPSPYPEWKKSKYHRDVKCPCWSVTPEYQTSHSQIPEIWFKLVFLYVQDQMYSSVVLCNTSYTATRLRKVKITPACPGINISCILRPEKNDPHIAFLKKIFVFWLKFHCITSNPFYKWLISS